MVNCLVSVLITYSSEQLISYENSIIIEKFNAGFMIIYLPDNKLFILFISLTSQLLSMAIKPFIRWASLVKISIDKQISC